MNDAKHSEREWKHFDAMTEDERHAAAVDDVDAQPLSEADLVRLTSIPRIKTIRVAIGLSQAEFAARFCIPLGTVRDWEQGRKHPDAAARAYLRVIASDPNHVAAALQRKAS